MTLLLFYFFLAVVVSFACSLMESVILSVTPAYIAVSVKAGKRSGRVLKRLKEQIDQPLAAILTLNTVANTVGAAGVGAQVLKVYGSGYLAISSGVLTLTILIVSEIIPKTLGASHWKSLAPLVAYGIRSLITVTYPFVVLTRYLRRLLSSKNDGGITREEMIETAEMGATSGAIRRKESTVIKNLLMLDNIKVSDIMTPRSVLVALNAKLTVGDVIEQFKTLRFSRIPLYKGDLDHVVGLLHRYKLMEAASQDLDDLTVEKLMKPIHSVPEDVSVSAAIDQFVKRKEHLFLVVDEYGITSGIVTLEDAIETLLGVEIMDELDSVADMREFAREQWRARKQKIR